MELRGKHEVSFQAVRGLAIECHALDLSACELLLFPVHDDSRGRTRATYDELLTSKMLALAIALRTKFYQGTPHQGTEQYLEHIGFFERERQGSTTTTKSQTTQNLTALTPRLGQSCSSSIEERA